MAEQILKSLYKNLKEPDRLVRDVIAREIPSKLGNILGSYTGEFKLVPISREGRVPRFPIKFCVRSKALVDNWKTRIVSRLPSKAEFWDEVNQTFSFEYKDYQVDLVVVSGDVDLATQMYSYDGIGRLYQAFANKMGYKLDLEGLKIPVNMEGAPAKEILIADNFYSIMPLLGFKSDMYSYVFHSDRSMFNSICNNTYYSSEVFEGENASLMEGWPHYPEFKNYVAQSLVANRHNYASGKTPWVNSLKKNHSDRLASAAEEFNAFKINSIIFAKTDDEIVQKATEIEDPKRIADFRVKFRNSFKSDYEFQQFVLTSSPSTIHSKMKDVFLEKSASKDKQEKQVFKLSTYKFPRNLVRNDVVNIQGYSIRLQEYFGDEANVIVVKAPAQYNVGSIGAWLTLPVEPKSKEKAKL